VYVSAEGLAALGIFKGGARKRAWLGVAGGVVASATRGATARGTFKNTQRAQSGSPNPRPQ